MDWTEFENLVEDTVAQMRAAAGDRQRIELAIRRYIDRGRKLGMSPMTLWDDFAISSPGIPERAGYAEDECDEMNTVFDRISRGLIGE